MRAIRLIVTDVDGVLTNGLMGFDAEGQPFRHFNVRDGLGLALWYHTGGKAALMSGQRSLAVMAIAQQWKCEECLMGVRDKASACAELAAQQGLKTEELAFIGDDLLDLGALEAVGLGIAVSDAPLQVKEAVDYVTEAAGGRGALREAIETILQAQGRLDEAIGKYRADPGDVQ